VNSGRVAPSPITYPDDLPIAQRRDDLLAAIRDNQVIVVAGETGSGKSTQLPKFCLEVGRGVDGWIGHTQPRRIAARAVAERVASELGSELGDTVGYAVRFTDKVGDQTMVKVMTDGILLAEIQRDRALARYDTIIIDEAHERSLNIDFLLGYLAQLLPRRPDLKVIITSATIDTDRFSRHFDNAPIVEVSGRAHPVEIRYQPLDQQPPIEQVQGICDAVTELFTEGDGDVLVFCSGEREIRNAVDAVVDLQLPHTQVLPLYARLSAAEQHRVFSQHKGRRVVVATNVAETSLTVPGIKYVIDTGTARISRFNRRTKVQRLPIEAISQASANQRSGRCGRIAPGIAIRLFAEDDYDARPEFTEPEIQRTNLASVILQMTSLGLGDVGSFPFVDPPDHRAIQDGISLLEELAAVQWQKSKTKRRGGPKGARSGQSGPDSAPHILELTALGRKLAKLPVDPRLGRMLLAADEYGCVDELLIIASALSIQDPRERPRDNQQAAAESHKRFADEDSDFITLLNLWRYLGEQRKALSSNAFRRQCRSEFLHYLRIREWQDVHSQLRRVAKEIGLRRNESPADHDVVHQALLPGLLSQVGAKDTKADARGRQSVEYHGARNAKFAIAPGSAMSKKSPKWIMAAEMVETNRLWARVTARTQPELIEIAADHLVKRRYTDPAWDLERGAAMAKESVTLYGLPLVSGRWVMWGRIDEADARDLFIRHALIDGEWEREHPFITHNAEMVTEVHQLEARARRSDMLVDVEVLVNWFDERLPHHIISVRHFDRWWKKAGPDSPDLLSFTLGDLIVDDAAAADPDAFPTHWHYGDVALALTYEFDPSSPNDGVTVDIPAGLLGQVDGAGFDWLVPGLRADLVTGLIRSMPKQYRKALVPIPETVEAVLPHLAPGASALVETLRAELGRHGGVDIPNGVLDLENLPLHLRPNFRIVNHDGQALATGGDLGALRSLLDEQVRTSLDASTHNLERAGLTEWDFGELPRYVEIEGSGHTVRTYPALVDEGDSVAIRLVSSAPEQRLVTWAGTRRLLVLNRPSVSKALRSLLTNDVKLALLQSPYPTAAEWFDDVLGCAVDEIMAERDAPAWTLAEWDRLLGHVRYGLPAGVGRIGGVSAALLQQVHTIEQMLAIVTAPKFAGATADMRCQLDSLIYPGFLTGVGARNLGNVERYLAAIEHRLDRLAENPDRDHDAMVRVHRLDHEHDRLIDQQGWTPQVEAIVWQLQELRVSLFAQHVGAVGQVSEKRIRNALDAASRPSG
jgi:ATP-dependent helicase HrpA